MTLQTARSIHFIGIGGIGISALAKWALEKGKQVSGSDLKVNATTTWLVEHGVRIAIGEHSAAHIPEDCDLVVHTVAVRTDNPEYNHARVEGVPVISYPEAVHQLLTGKQGIAIAGTHGKSTTTALLAYILVEAGHDPTVIVGTRVRLFENTNERIGKGPTVLIEADEYNQGILLYHPMHAVVLNVDHEHVDVYPTLEEARAAFATFVSHTHPAGTVTLNADDPSTAILQQHATAPVRTFGMRKGDLHTTKVLVTTKGQEVTVAGLYNGTVQTQLFGDHNVRNVLAALCVAHSLDIPFTTVQKAVAAFPGTWRRFEKRGSWHGAILVDDYAHHPTEVAATLQAARQAFSGQRIVCVFQPHLRSRTKAFAADFVQALSLADICILLEVYDVAGREEAEDISSKGIAEALGKRGVFVQDLDAAVAFAKTLVQPNDVVITMGAGDITHFSDIVLKENPS